MKSALRDNLLPVPQAVLLSIALLVGSPAFAQKITVDFDQSANFAKYKTFMIRNGQLNSMNPALNSDLVKKQIEADIRTTLTARGLSEVSEHPDLNVIYHFGSIRKAELESRPVGWRGLGTQWVRVPTSEGTLVIDLRDPSIQSLVWRGIASQENSDPTKIRGKLDDMVKKSLSKYPPKMK